MYHTFYKPVVSGPKAVRDFIFCPFAGIYHCAHFATVGKVTIFQLVDVGDCIRLLHIIQVRYYVISCAIYNADC